MKQYAIRTINSSTYVEAIADGCWFSFTYDIAKAHRFRSIEDIIDTFVTRAKVKPDFSHHGYTIVRLEEINVPQFKEVEL